MTPTRPAIQFIEILEVRIAPATFSVPALNGADGFKINGEVVNDDAGFVVRDAGDVNDDGFGDLIVGAPNASPNGQFSGAAYVIFGKAHGSSASFDLADLDGTNGFKIVGAAAGDSLGFGVGAAGDVNGDNFDDVIVGAIAADAPAQTSGASYVIFGKASGFTAILNPSTLSGTDGFKISGAAVGDASGASVGSAGDVNHDGFDDVIIGAPSAAPNGQNSGAAYVVFGKGTAFAANLDLSALTGSDGFKISGTAMNDFTGSEVSGAGDINGDSFDDVIVSAPDAPNGNDTGAAYVIFGKGTAFAANLNVSALTGTDGFTINGVVLDDQFGVSVRSAGDINGDGLADLIIGAVGADPHGDFSGASYLIFGSSGAFAATLDLTTLDGINGFKISGAAAGNFAGKSVSGAGDVNGDGLDDLIVGAPSGVFGTGTKAGTAYLIFGKAEGYAANLELSSLKGSSGLKIANAPQGESFGFSVSTAGDVNGDGFDDVIVGDRANHSYVFFGFDPNIVPSANGKTLTLPDSDGDIITIKTTKGRLVPQQIFRAPDGSIKFIDLTHLTDTGASGFAGFAGSGDAEAKTSGGSLTPGKVSNLVIFAKRPRHGSGDGIVNVGAIDAAGINLGTLKVSGSLGDFNAGAGLEGGRALKSLQLGALTGNAVVAGTLGVLKIKHDVKGVLNVTGGPASEAGLNEVSQVFISKVIIGGDLDGSAGGSKAGLLRVRGGIGSIVIKGSVIGGADLSGVVVGGRAGTIKIAGDLTSADPSRPVTVSALGKVGATKAAETVALQKLNIAGAVLNAQILAGYKRDLTPLNPDAGIGKITVQGDWSASSVAAGVADSTLDGFGQNDTLIAGDTTPAILSRIASIVINGVATGSAAMGDFFGITAQQIGVAKIQHSSLATANQDNLPLDAVNNDFRLVEV